MTAPSNDAWDSEFMEFVRANETPDVIRYVDELFRQRRELSARLDAVRPVGFLRARRAVSSGMSPYLVNAIIALVAYALGRYAHLHP